MKYYMWAELCVKIFQMKNNVMLKSLFKANGTSRESATKEQVLFSLRQGSVPENSSYPKQFAS